MPVGISVVQVRIIYALLGVLLGFLTFARVSAWVVKTTTHLIKQLVTRLSFEIINQLSQFLSRSSSTFGGSSGRDQAVLSKGGQTPAMPQPGSLPLILDTSSIIDGRILDVAKTGFLPGMVWVPNFVLTELRQVADSADYVKRARGRRGFQIIEQMKKINGIKLEVWDKELAGKSVDDKLTALGKILHGRIITSDFNLNRSATLNGVKVLNLNDLANALKTLPVPGESIKIKIIQHGKERDQGVGYLPDGTMVVVKGGSMFLDQEIEVEVSKILQSPSGRMIFATKLSVTG